MDPYARAQDTKFWTSMIFRLLLLSAVLSAATQARTAWSAETPATDADEQMAVLVPARIDLDIRVVCEADRVAFRLINRGTDWPEKGIIAIHSEDHGDTISSREMRMKNGQTLTFRIKTGGREVGALGLDVNAPWVEQSFDRHVTISCP